MILDLYQNHLVFREVPRPSHFIMLLQQAKGAKWRQVQNTFFVPLEHLDGVRMALAPIRQDLRLTPKYLKFAERFLTSDERIVIDWYPSYAEFRGKGMPWHKIIPATSYFNKAALNSKAYESGRWDGHTHLFDSVTGRVPSGLIERIVKILAECQVPFDISRHFDYPAPSYEWIPTFQFNPTQDQLDAVQALDQANHGIAKLPTGFGKTSYVAAALIAKKGVRSLFLANQRVLIQDAKRDFEQVFGDQVSIGMIGDGEYDPKPITVASIQGIVAALTLPSALEWKELKNELGIAQRRCNQDDCKENRAALKRIQNKVDKMTRRTERYSDTLSYLKSVTLFIVDESQVLGTDMWDLFLGACPAPYRYTLSATDTRSDGGRIQIIAATGERRYESTAADQIAKKRLAEFRAYFGKFDHNVPKHVIRNLNMEYHQAYDYFIVNNELRNRHLCEKVIEYRRQGHAVIALITVIRHADIIFDALKAMGIPEDQMAVVSGQTPKKKRNDAIERFRSGEIPILIGSSIFDVGFNAKNAARMVRFNAGGSEIRETQRAGRTVRMREDESHGETYDLIDMNVPFFQAQAWKRVQLLKDEFGKDRVVIMNQVIMGSGQYDVLKVSVPSASPQMDLSDFIEEEMDVPVPQASEKLLKLIQEFS